MDFDVSYPVRWAVIYRALTIGALVGGLALVAFGFLTGFRGALFVLLEDPLNPGPAIEQANPSITLIFSLLGIVVWQFGKAYALFVTLPRASGRAASRKLGSKGRSRVTLAELDERLAAMEAEIAQARREIRTIEDVDASVDYDEREHLVSGADSVESPADTGSDSEARSARASERAETTTDDDPNRS